MLIPINQMIRKACLATLILLAVQTQAQNTLADAINLTRSEQFDAAKNLLESLMKADPNNGDLYFYYGENHLAAYFADTITVTLNDVLALATPLFLKGIEVDPKNPLCYVGIGKVALLKGNAAEALDNFQAAFNTYPSRANKESTISLEKQALTNAKVAEAMIQAEVQNLAKAKELIENAAKSDPKNPEIFLIWGDVFLAENDGSNAILKYNAAQELDPQSPSAKLRLGKLWVRARNWPNAIGFYEEAIAINANFAPAYVELGAIYMMAKQNEKAKENFQKYLNISSTVQAKRKYASVLIDLKDYSTAIPILLEINQTDPSQNDINRALAYCYFETKDFEKAKSFMDTFFNNTTPEKIILSDWVYRGKIEKQLKNDSAAIEYLKTALDIDSSQWDLYTEIALSFFVMKNFEQATEWFQKKIDLERASNFDYFTMGNAFIALSELEKADSAFAVITERSPEYRQGRALLLRARLNNTFDADGSLGLANPFYESYITYAKEDSVRNAKELIEAYDFFQFHYLKIRDYCNAKQYVRNILATDPEGNIADIPKFNDLLRDYVGKCPDPKE